MNDLWIDHYSIEAWSDPKRWVSFFEQVQQVLASPLTHLDVNDRVRRKVASLEDAGDFVCAFGPRDDSRWVFGEFKALGIDFSIRHFRQLGQWPNSLTWHVPLPFVEKFGGRQRLKGLFDLGNQSLRPFYAFSDERVQITSKKKSSGAIDIETELPGVFWLTYFNSAYVAFFGDEKFNRLPGVERSCDGSITIVLGDDPQSVTNELREQSAAMLGKQSFVNPSDIVGKQRGRFALTFQQLLPER